MSREYEDIQAIFVEIDERLQEVDLSSVFRDTVSYMLKDEHEVFFASQRAPDGGMWAPLSPRTVKRKGHSVILIDTGQMQESLMFDGPNHIEEITPLAMSFGTDIEYAKYHMSGTRRMPARPFLGIRPETEEKIADVLAEEVARQLE